MGMPYILSGNVIATSSRGPSKGSVGVGIVLWRSPPSGAQGKEGREAAVSVSLSK